ncbi:hypothetical protein NPIL_211841 [Nephila pilipes]|uniref:Uncharacterized protein n=1 Tax=Nephila pilipes TaxID=299642 RepID=A0A8X6UHR1_NEPPI|nr:hypothetical protein NPIL_211841 [Nephila pilipes]
MVWQSFRVDDWSDPLGSSGDLPFRALYGDFYVTIFDENGANDVQCCFFEGYNMPLVKKGSLIQIAFLFLCYPQGFKIRIRLSYSFAVTYSEKKLVNMEKL